MGDFLPSADAKDGESQNLPSIVVVGSLNVDLVVPVPSHPAAGQTVIGGDFFRNPGGKGANQAIASARLGQRVAMVGCVGQDDDGLLLLDALRAEGVDCSRVLSSADAPTGLALIAVEQGGENSIIVSPGANQLLRPGDVRAASQEIHHAGVTLVQLEIPMQTVMAAVQEAGGTVILNPAPAQVLPPEMLEAVDILIPNRGELAEITNSELPVTFDEVVDLARVLHGPDVVIVTLGEEGAALVDANHAAPIPAIPVYAVDTTAAGDSFCGALADALVRGLEVENAVQFAVAAAALTTTRKGAQASMPTRHEVETMLEERRPGRQSQGPVDPRADPEPPARGVVGEDTEGSPQTAEGP